MNQHIRSHKAKLKRKTWLCASREFTLNVCEHSWLPGCDTCCPPPKITCIFWPSVSATLALLSSWYSLLWGIRNSYELWRLNLYLYTQLWLKTRLLSNYMVKNKSNKKYSNFITCPSVYPFVTYFNIALMEKKVSFVNKTDFNSSMSVLNFHKNNK